jgi:hypothetical protein
MNYGNNGGGNIGKTGLPDITQISGKAGTDSKLNTLDAV